MERTLRDRDIARMSALKAAVEMTTTFHDIEASVERASDAAITLAEKFYSWILRPADHAQGDEQEESNYLDMLQKDIHRLEDQLKLRRTDFAQERPQLFDSWEEGGAQHLLEQLRIRIQHGSEAGSHVGDVDQSGWKKRSIYEGDMNTFPITKKQYGFLIGLHRKLGKQPDKDALNELNTREASSLIDQLQEQVASTGNGKSDSGQPPR